MKKTFITVFACLMAILTLMLTACGDDRNGSYYPTNEEMKTNLEKQGYVVTIFNDLSVSGIGDESLRGDVNGTLLTATKSREIDGVVTTDFLYFYRLDESSYCDYYYGAMENNFEDYDSLVKIENDKNFGNIVYCGTENAISASGIKIVEVNVKV